MTKVHNVVTPGEASQPAEPVVQAAGKTTEPLVGTVEEQLAAMQAQMADMNRLIADQAKQLRGVKPPASMPAAVKHMTMAEAKASNPDAPVLTEEGWYCPRVTTSNPEQAMTKDVIAGIIKAAKE